MHLSHMRITVSKYTKDIGLHMLLWLAVWFYYVYFFSYGSNNKDFTFWLSSCLLPVTMFTTYLVSYYLIPKYLVKKRYGTFTLYVLYTIIISSYLIIMSIFGCFIILSAVDVDNMPLLSRNFWFVIALVYLVVAAVSALRIMQLGQQSIAKARVLEREFLEGKLKLKEQELSYLKKQIHPHFLFNTLNTIYGLSMRKAQQTPEVILKLSNLLDYLLYQVNKPLVPIADELAHIQEYIDLEHIRFQDTMQVHIAINVAHKSLEIPPMLLIPLVENAFKHGAIIDGKLIIKVDCSLNNDLFLLQVTNSYRLDSKQEKTGIGLENLNKRLTHYFADRYALEAQVDAGMYTAKLTIKEIHKIAHENL